MKQRLTYTTTLSPKGQITLPIAWRRKRNIKPGDRFVISTEHGDILIQPSRRKKDNDTKAKEKEIND